MKDSGGSTPWAVERFGDATPEVLEQVPAALRAADARSRAGHLAAGLKTNEVYGGSLWLTLHEELLTHIRGVAGVQVIKPPRARYELAVVNGVLIYPWRYAADLATPVRRAQLRRPVSHIRRSLLALNPSAPPEPTLFDDGAADLEGEEALYAAKEVTDSYARVVLLAYASNPQGGVLSAQWGDAHLLAGDELYWNHLEMLPMTSGEEGGFGVREIHTGPTPSGPGQATQFDAGPLEDFDLGTKAPGEVVEPDETPGEEERAREGSDERP